MSTLKLRKIFAAFTLTTLVASLFVVAPATQAAPPAWWTEGTELLDQVDPMFGDENQVEADKCRVSALLTAALGLEENPAAAASYTDIPAGCEGVAGAMISAGIIMGEGNDGETFGSYNETPRVVFTAMLSRAFNLSQEYPNAELSASDAAELADMNAEWAGETWAQVRTAGIYQQTRPSDLMNVYEMTTAISRALNPDSIPTPENPAPTGGDLEITISDLSPKGGTLPGGVSNAHVGTLEFSAGDDDVVINAITLSRGGITNDDALKEVALYDENGARISKSKSFNDSEDEARVNFLSGGFTLEAGESVDVLIIGEVGTAAEAAGSEFFVEVESADDVISNASSVTVDEARTATWEVGAIDAATLIVENSSSSPDVNVGEQGVEIQEFDLENDSNDSDIDFFGITFETGGSYDEEDDVRNYELYLEGDLVASTEMAKDGYVSFLLDEPFRIREGKRIDAQVRADILSGANEDIEFTIEEGLDVLARDVSLSEGAIIDTTGFTALPTRIEAGEMTVVAIDPELREFTEGQDNFVLGTLRVTANAGDQLEIEKLVVDIDYTAGGFTNVDDIIENVEAVTSTSLYDLDQIGGSSASEQYGDSSIDIPVPSEGSFDITIRADIIEDIVIDNDDKLELSVTSIGGSSASSSNFFVIETSDNDEPVEDITPSSLSFDELEGSASSLTATALIQTAQQNVVVDNDAVVMAFELEAGDTSDILVENIVFEADLTDNGVAGDLDNDYFTLFEIYEENLDGEPVATESGNEITGGEIEFDNVDFTILADEDVKYLLVATLSTDENNSGDEVTFQINRIDAEETGGENSDNDDVNVENSQGGDLQATVSGSDGPEVAKGSILIQGEGTLRVDIDNTLSQTSGNEVVLGGTTSEFVAAFEFVAENEDITLEDFEITDENGEDLNDHISEIILYGNDQVTEVARESVNSGTVTFNNEDILLPEGTTYLYAKVVAVSMGKNNPSQSINISPDYQLQLEVLDARGSSALTPGDIDHNFAVSGVQSGPTSASNAFQVAPVRVDDIRFVDENTQYNVSKDENLSVGEVTVGVLEIDNANHNNNEEESSSLLETVLSRVEFDVDLNGVTADDISLRRLDIAQQNLTSIGDLSDADNRALQPGELNEASVKIAPGTTAVFEVVVNVTALAGANDNDDSIQVELNGLDGGAVFNYTTTNPTDFDNGGAAIDPFTTPEANETVTEPRLDNTDAKNEKIFG